MKKSASFYSTGSCLAPTFKRNCRCLEDLLTLLAAKAAAVDFFNFYILSKTPWLLISLQPHGQLSTRQRACKPSYASATRTFLDSVC